MKFRTLIILTCVLTQSCTSLTLNDSWPNNLPAKERFIESCKNKQGCSTYSQTAEHLNWIKRFYFGSLLYSTGWHEMTDRVIATVDEHHLKAPTKQRLDDLGFTIANEWARDNDVRLIDSRMLVIWGNALSTSADKKEQVTFISQVEEDVRQVLNGSLKSQEITDERYYPVEDYDNF